MDKTTKIRFIALLIALPFVVFLAFQLNTQMEKKNYRIDYLTLIRRYAKEYDLDPYVVAAVIHCESNNRSTAVSQVGAIGLMQLMPDTGEWIAGKLGDGAFDAEGLKDPDINIRYGCWYLDFLYARFDSDETVFAAYNAGHNRVRAWLDDGNYSIDGSTLAEIPFPETKYYIEKVQRAYDKYKKLYPDVFE